MANKVLSNRTHLKQAAVNNCTHKKYQKFHSSPSLHENLPFFILITLLYARYLCSRDALGQARRATIGYLVYKSHLTYGITCWGGTYKSKLQRIFNLQKRCVRILFGEIYLFDHPEYYYTCARAKTFTEHMAQKEYESLNTQNQFLINTTYLTCIICMS